MRPPIEPRFAYPFLRNGIFFYETPVGTGPPCSLQFPRSVLGFSSHNVVICGRVSLLHAKEGSRHRIRVAATFQIRHLRPCPAKLAFWDARQSAFVGLTLQEFCGIVKKSNEGVESKNVLQRFAVHFP